jgi:uncharacterized membrane protein
MKLSTRKISLIAILVAFYYVASLLPGVPIPGLAGTSIGLGATIASIFGIMLGPYLGFLTGFLGAFTALILSPGGMSIFGVPFLLSPPMNALVTGLIFKSTNLSTESSKYKKGWVAAFIILGLLNLLFWATPLCQPIGTYYYIGIAANFDKIIAWLLIVPTILMARNFSATQKRTFAFFFLLAFIGNQSDAAVGNLIFALPFVYKGIFGFSLDAVRVLFLLSPIYYPVVRIIESLIAALIAVPLVRALKARGWNL